MALGTGLQPLHRPFIDIENRQPGSPGDAPFLTIFQKNSCPLQLSALGHRDYVVRCREDAVAASDIGKENTCFVTRSLLRFLPLA